MPVALRSAWSATIALAGASVIAVSPLTPVPDTPVPTVSAPAIALADVSTPAIGAIPYQIGINILGDVLAATPILIGSTEQCTVCLGPNEPLSPLYLPFTGWGVIGLGAGLISSPVALVEALRAGQDVGQALGVAALAIQAPITNTFALLAADRTPTGGFELQAVLDRAGQAIKDGVDSLLNIAGQALVTGPITVIQAAVTGATAFAATLAETGDFIAAVNAGRAPFEAAVNTALTDLTDNIQQGRTTVYADLTAGPGVATSPIPTVTSSVIDPPVAAASPATTASPTVATGQGPVTKVVDSFKATPKALAAASATGGSSSTAAGPSGDTTAKASSTPQKKRALGGSKRQRAASAH